ncbi:MAG: aromatic acid exporter family protein [Erysipelotrichaceae bacterium]|nr:aromatic acid exporter family protein [Erysipelotrichaceae bacterium]MDY5252043.1 aromatic acid exporter family protein [Erysipelotrichaceae bacterium]
MTNTIGLRTIKTAISVFLSMYLGNLFNFAYPFHIAIAAMFALDKTAFGSFKLGRNRIVGSIIGACIGVLFSYIDRGNPFLCALAIAIQIYICNALNLKGAIIISGIMMLIIMGNEGNDPIYYGFYRSADTIIGVIISVIVNITIFPYNSLKRLDETAIKIWEQTDQLIIALRKHEMVNIDKINQEIEELGVEINAIEQNFLYGKQKQYVHDLQKHYEICRKLLLEANICLTIDPEKDKIVYGYHIEKALSIYDNYVAELQKA